MYLWQHAEAAGINLETFVEAVLGTKVRDQAGTFARLTLMRRHLVEIRIETGQHFRVALEVRGVFRGAIEDSLVDTAEKQARVAPDFAPELSIQGGEERPRRSMPGEPQVARELGQASQSRRKRGVDLKNETGGVHSARRGCR